MPRLQCTEGFVNLSILERFTVPDSSLAGTVNDLELWRVPWADVMREGYFGKPGQPETKP